MKFLKYMLICWNTEGKHGQRKIGNPSPKGSVNVIQRVKRFADILITTIMIKTLFRLSFLHVSVTFIRMYCEYVTHKCLGNAGLGYLGVRKNKYTIWGS